MMSDNVSADDVSTMTISEYCNISGVNQRYLRRIVTANKKELLKDSYGIISYRLFGKTYILTVIKHIKLEPVKPEQIIPKPGPAKSLVVEVPPKIKKAKHKKEAKILNDKSPGSKKKSPTVISFKDAKNMVDTGVADCTCDIVGSDGSKILTSFQGVEDAIKKRKETNSNGRIWIWNKETNDHLYIVDKNGKVF